MYAYYNKISFSIASMYLDYNANVPLKNDVKKHICNLLDLIGNPSSTHSYGRATRKIVEDARDKLASLLKIEAKRIVWTSSATESNNLALKGYEGPVIVASTEHTSVLRARNDAIICGVDSSGIINLSMLENLLQKHEKALVCIMLANNETGVIQPFEKVSELCKKYNSFFFSDCCQGFGRIKNIDWKLLDMFSLSSHKIGGPLGAAALIIAEKINLKTLFDGEGQEGYLRSGTLNFIGIAGFVLAAEIALKEDWQYAEIMRNNVEDRLKNICPQVCFIGEESRRLPNVTNIFMPAVPRATQVMYFDLEGIALSAGSACSSGKQSATSHVLDAMHIKDTIAKNCIRLSFGLDVQNLDIFIDTWQKIYEKGQRRAS